MHAADHHQCACIDSLTILVPCHGHCSVGACVLGIAGGREHNVALLQDGTLQSWGGNRYGQLGDGTSSNRLSPVPIPGLSDVRAIARGAASEHTVVVLNNGSVLAWGSNDYMQLGDGTTTARMAPVHVSGLTDVQAVATGHAHTIALLNDGTVKAWGSNAYGQLGDDSTTDHSLPTSVPGLSGVTAIAAGQWCSYALLGNGNVMAWGDNTVGELGDNTTTARPAPVQVNNLGDVRAISAGLNHVLVLLGNGSVMAWGGNGVGQLGDGSTTNRVLPVLVPGLSNVQTVVAGGSHSVALLNGGMLMTWGVNVVGQLGVGGLAPALQTSPSLGPGLELGARAIAVGGDHTMVLTYGTDVPIMAWGGNIVGQIGDGTSLNIRTSPVAILGLRSCR